MSSIENFINRGIKFIDNKFQEATSNINSQSLPSEVSSSVDSNQQANENSYKKSQGFQNIKKPQALVDTAVKSDTVTLGQLSEQKYGSLIKNENPLSSPKEVYGTGGLALVTTRGQGGNGPVAYNDNVWFGDDQGSLPQGLDGSRSIYSKPTAKQRDLLAERKDKHEINQAHANYRQNLAAVEQAEKGLGDLIDGAVYGSCGEYDTDYNAASETAVGAIPLVGQAADLRDLVCSGGKLFDDFSFRNAAGVGLSAIAFVPVLGDYGASLGRNALKRAPTPQLTQGSAVLSGGTRVEANSVSGGVSYNPKSDQVDSDVSHWIESTRGDGGKWMDDVDLSDVPKPAQGSAVLSDGTRVEANSVSGGVSYNPKSDQVDSDVAHWIGSTRDDGGKWMDDVDLSDVPKPAQGSAVLSDGTRVEANSVSGGVSYNPKSDQVDSNISHWIESTRGDGGKWMDSPAIEQALRTFLGN